MCYASTVQFPRYGRGRKHKTIQFCMQLCLRCVGCDSRGELSPESYGGHSEGETPGSIPNPEAKPFSADGTALVTVWESRTPPDIHYERAPTGINRSGLFCVCRKIADVDGPTNDGT